MKKNLLWKIRLFRGPLVRKHWFRRCEYARVYKYRNGHRNEYTSVCAAIGEPIDKRNETNGNEWNEFGTRVVNVVAQSVDVRGRWWNGPSLLESLSRRGITTVGNCPLPKYIHNNNTVTGITGTVHRQKIQNPWVRHHVHRTVFQRLSSESITRRFREKYVLSPITLP